MRFVSFQPGGLSLGAALVMAGVWFLVREVFQPGPWFAPATLAALAAVAALVWAATRSLSWLTGFFFAASWALYKALDVWWFEGTLPGSFLPAFWAFGFMMLYAVGTRPFRWPLIPAGALIAIATVMYVIAVGVETARYWVPAALVLWGVYVLVRGVRGGPGNYIQ